MSENKVADKSVANFGAVETGTTFNIPLECVGTYNVRSVFPRLAAVGVTYEKLIGMALGTPEERAEMVRLVQEHETESSRLDPSEQTIVELANSIFDNGQLQPIIVRQTGLVNRKDDTGKVIGKRYGYQIVMGGRRTMAVAYLVALGLRKQPFVEGKQKKMSKEEALDMSIAENLQRRNFSNRELGEIVATMRDTGKTWVEIVQRLRRSEPTLRTVFALVRPEDENAPDDLPEQIEAGTLTMAQGAQIARGKTSVGDGGERLFRTVRKVVSVKTIEALIDTTVRDEVGVVRITALAEALGSTYEVEVKSSDERLAKAVVDQAKNEAKAEAERVKAEAKALTDQAKALREAAKARLDGAKVKVITETTRVLGDEAEVQEVVAETIVEEVALDDTVESAELAEEAA